MRGCAADASALEARHFHGAAPAGTSSGDPKPKCPWAWSGVRGCKAAALLPQRRARTGRVAFSTELWPEEQRILSGACRAALLIVLF